jgi:hypothetical protein
MSFISGRIRPRRPLPPVREVVSPGQEPSPASVERDLAGRIFTTSAQLVGVCLTVIGLFRIVSHLKNINSVADNLMAIDALVFLGSCLLSYLALRSLKTERSLALEQAADVVFLLGLGTMVALCALVAWELI